MDIEEIRADCSKACIKQADVCLTGNHTSYRCYTDYRRCLDECTAAAQEDVDV